MKQSHLAMAKDEAFVTPAMLKWARERAGYSVHAVAQRLKVKPERVQAWESGDARPTIGRCDALATLYKRPSALFYMAKPPQERDDRPTDFREMPSALEPGLIYQMRRALERHNAALNLLAELGEEPKRFSFICKLDDDEESAGSKLRDYLAVTTSAQRQWSKDRDGYDAFNGWKDAAEATGVLVFQASKRHMGAARGFSMHEELLPMVVVSSDDAPVGRLFTVAHELAHISLREGGLCDLHNDGVELFCNRVAAAALMPRAEVHALLGKRARLRHDWDDLEIEQLARPFSVSREALLLRLVGFGYATWDFYRKKATEYRALYAKQPKAKGQPAPHTVAIARNGRGFTRVVLEAYYRGNITERRASTYLGVSFETLPKIANEMLRRAS